MPISLDVVQSVTDPGHPGRENEDRAGWNRTAVFVVDGATGLGDPVVRPPRSDAAWLAEHAVGRLDRGFAAGLTTRAVVRDLNRSAAAAFAEAADIDRIERYRLPVASFLSVRVAADGIEAAGLGDCVLILRDANGEITRWSGLAAPRAREQSSARKALDHAGGFDREGVTIRERDTLAALRASRARYNLPGGGLWTLGLEPHAADHLAIVRLDPALPVTGIVCTDGFADLVDNYARYDDGGLIAAAEAKGLDSLLAELRWVENELDPTGASHPRFKRSDDATAILFRLTAS
ncbi:MAG: protein phosphatase 2C domain-containing protein [Bauldia sp.]|nr:protein phosphatase 2C domain-containing protein [Bauldia sp.]